MRKYTPAPQVDDYARPLIEHFHPHLAGVPCIYVFVDELPITGGKKTLARIRKVSGLNAFLITLAYGQAGDRSGLCNLHTNPTDGILVMEIVKPEWDFADARKRFATVDHELSHVKVTDKAKLLIIKHFLEEFPEVIDRWGVYLEDRREFAQTCRRQLRLEAAGQLPDGMRADFFLSLAASFPQPGAAANSHQGFLDNSHLVIGGDSQSVDASFEDDLDPQPGQDQTAAAGDSADERAEASTGASQSPIADSTGGSQSASLDPSSEIAAGTTCARIAADSSSEITSQGDLNSQPFLSTTGASARGSQPHNTSPPPN